MAFPRDEMMLSDESDEEAEVDLAEPWYSLLLHFIF